MRRSERRRRAKAFRRREAAAQVQAKCVELKPTSGRLTPHRRMQAFKNYARHCGRQEVYYLCISDDTRQCLNGPGYVRETFREKKSFKSDDGELEIARRIEPYAGNFYC